MVLVRTEVTDLLTPNATGILCTMTETETCCCPRLEIGSYTGPYSFTPTFIITILHTTTTNPQPVIIKTTLFPELITSRLTTVLICNTTHTEIILLA